MIVTTTADGHQAGPAAAPAAPIVAHQDAWGAFADLDALPPASEWQLVWYGFDTGQAA